MEQFKRVSVDLIPDIIAEIEKNTRFAKPQSQMLEMMRQCKKMDPTLDVRVYTPGGGLDGYGTFFFHVPEHRFNILFHTTYPDLDSFRRRLLEIPNIDWTNHVVLGPCDSRFHSMVLQIAKDKQLCFVEELQPSDNCAIPRQVALDLKVEVPSGMELRPLREDDAEFVNDRWPHKGPRTLRYVRDAIKLNGGVALYFKGSNVPVAWGLHSLVGGVGMIKTEEEHRGKRFGEVIGKALTKMVAEKGLEPQLQIKQGISASLRLFTRMGYKVTHQVYYYWFAPPSLIKSKL